jgi:hypothetical protein
MRNLRTFNDYRMDTVRDKLSNVNYALNVKKIHDVHLYE